jgi:dolichol kinase
MVSKIVSSCSSEPSRLEIGLAAVFAVQVVAAFLVATISVAWLATGAVVFALALGPGADSIVGTRIGAWFRAIGTGGRLLVIAGFAVTIWTALAVLPLPRVLIHSFTTGGLLAVVAIIVLQTVRTHGLS